MGDSWGQPATTPSEPLVPPSTRPVTQPPRTAGVTPPTDTATWQQPTPHPYGGWPPAPASGDPSAAEALRKARTALGWAIGAAAIAGLAVIGMLVALVLGGSSALDDPSSYETLRGQVVGLPEGSALSGDRLEHPLVDALQDVGAEEVDVTCPDTASASV